MINRRLSMVIGALCGLFVAIEAWMPSDRTTTSRNLNRCHQSYVINRKNSPLLLSSNVSAMKPLFAVSESEATEQYTESSSPPTVSFTSPVMQVYIEDTDAYAMKYNTNYLRSYERALHVAEDIATESILSQHPDDWTLTKVTNQKFKATAALGGTFVITGTLVEKYEESEVWNMEMKCPETGTVYNSATVTIGLPLSFSEVEPTIAVNGDDDEPSAVHHDTLHRDEFDPHHPNHLPLRSVLNLCERSRSSFIGGPDALSRMQQEDNTMVIVTTIDDLLSYPHHCYPRQKVRVETKFTVKRRGLICEAQHRLFDEKSDDPIAQAIVTMVALDATTKRPVKWPL